MEIYLNLPMSFHNLDRANFVFYNAMYRWCLNYSLCVMKVIIL